MEILELCNTWSESFTGGAWSEDGRRLSEAGNTSVEIIKDRKNIKEKWTEGQGPVEQYQTV